MGSLPGKGATWLASASAVEVEVKDVVPALPLCGFAQASPPRNVSARIAAATVLAERYIILQHSHNFILRCNKILNPNPVKKFHFALAPFSVSSMSGPRPYKRDSKALTQRTRRKARAQRRRRPD